MGVGPEELNAAGEVILAMQEELEDLEASLAKFVGHKTSSPFNEGQLANFTQLNDPATAASSFSSRLVPLLAAGIACKPEKEGGHLDEDTKRLPTAELLKPGSMTMRLSSVSGYVRSSQAF
ncbi:hypothetical protein WJX74_008411 [Apatococcus lobatus]|uniref:Uncharacterized protein n=1 Tax=Apatococcus lobatus TaxID=904363 RepID=A0AAW1QVQ4_9CHLO